jgi:hypothetical protein
MAPRTPPLYLQAGSHTAENDRLGIQALVQQQGVVLAPGYLPQITATKTGDLAVNQAGTPSMSLVVSAGSAYINGTTTSTQGAYFFYNDAAYTVGPLATAPTSNTRIDLIIARINDAQYAGSTNSATIEVVTGTAAASPVAPSAPASSLILAQVLVGTNVTSILNASITDKRTRAARQDAYFVSDATTSDTATIGVLASQTGYALAIRDSSGNLLNGFTASGALVGGGGYTDIFMLMGA